MLNKYLANVFSGFFITENNLEVRCWSDVKYVQAARSGYENAGYKPTLLWFVNRTKYNKDKHVFVNNDFKHTVSSKTYLKILAQGKPVESNKKTTMCSSINLNLVLGVIKAYTIQ